MNQRHCNSQRLPWLGGRCVHTWLHLLWERLSEFTERFLVSGPVAISREFSLPHGWISNYITTSSFPKFKERNSTRPQVFACIIPKDFYRHATD